MRINQAIIRKLISKFYNPNIFLALLFHTYLLITLQQTQFLTIMFLSKLMPNVNEMQMQKK